MLTSSGEEPLGKDFSELGENKEFTWHQFHVKDWGSRDFEGHTTVVMHNGTGLVLPLIWIRLDSQLMVDLMSNPRMFLNIRRVWSKDTICVHSNIWVKVMDRISNLPS